MKALLYLENTARSRDITDENAGWVHLTIVGKFSIEGIRHCHFDWRPRAGMEKSPLGNAARLALAQISPLQSTFGGLPVEMTPLTGLPTKMNRTHADWTDNVLTRMHGIDYNQILRFPGFGSLLGR